MPKLVTTFATHFMTATRPYPARLGLVKYLMRHNQFTYLMTYRCVKAPPEDQVVSFKYLVPCHGGSFVMQPGLIAQQPILVEFSYVKMIAINIIHSLNEEQMARGELPLAPTAIQNERKKA